MVKEYQDTKILMLTQHESKEYVLQVMKAGADGYLLKNSGKEEITTAIRKVMSGERYFTWDVTLSLLNNKNTESTIQLDDHLTGRELEILKLIAEGFTNKEIGEQLFISHRTVDTHRTNMMRKLGVNNLAGLINYAIKHNIITW